MSIIFFNSFLHAFRSAKEMAVSKENLSSPQKLALIIANDNYSESYNILNQSCNNADDLSTLLKTSNFRVTKSCNLNKQEMTTCIIDFARNVHDGDLVLFYYSGHACHLNTKNYLIPVDVQIESDRDIEDFTVNIERQLERLTSKNSSSLTMFILDCCKPYLLKNVTTSNS